MADFEFLIMIISRLRRAACLAQQATEATDSVKNAINAFDKALPTLKKLRDVAEHIDEYSMDNGRNKSVSRMDLEVSSLTHHGQTFTWLGESINVDRALEASTALFKSIKEAREFLGRMYAPSREDNQTRTTSEVQ